MEALPSRYAFQDRLPQELRPHTLAWHIQEFDRNPAKNGLDANWYKFHGIGFLMNAQMKLLPENAEYDREKRDVWAQQTKRDILGFGLEYLSKSLVFSYKYHIAEKSDGTQELVDPLYGNRSALEMIDPRERGGVVRKTMQNIQDFFLDPATPDGAVAVMPSPKGPSGLTTDDGKAIEYLTSFFFVMEKKGDEVIGSTIKTDFTNTEYRALISALTGKLLPFDASVQDFVGAAALVTPQGRRDGVQSRADVVRMMREVKQQYRGVDKAFEDRDWQEVYDGVAKGEELYNFSKKTHDFVDEFMQFVAEGGHSRTDLQKAVAATLLRVSQLFLTDSSASVMNKNLISTRTHTVDRPTGPVQQNLSFGQVVKEVQKIPGCAGGGEENSITSVLSIGGQRSGKIREKSAEDASGWFECPHCSQRAKPPVGDECPNCHYTKADFVREHPELAC